MKYVYQYMDCSLCKDVLSVTNRYDFTNLSEYKFVYEIKVDGKVTERNETFLDVKPKESTDINITLPKNCRMGAYLHCYLYDNDGYCVAQKQLEIPAEIIREEPSSTPAKVSEDKNFIIFEGKGFKYTFSKNIGMFTSLFVNGEEQLLSPMKITAMRAPIDNERKIEARWYWHNSWEGENLDRQFNKLYEYKLRDNMITVTGNLAGVSRVPFFQYTLKYTVTDEGKISHV